MLEVRDLDSRYGRIPALAEVALDVHTGELVALIGANGAGKTTTLRALCQIVRTTGSLAFNGGTGEVQLVGKATENVVRLGVGHVPDGRGTFTALSVEDNLKLGAYVRSDRAEVAHDIDKAYTRFPRLAERRAKGPATKKTPAARKPRRAAGKR